MSVVLLSALSGSTMSIPFSISSPTKPLPKLHLSGGVFPAIECSSRPQKKATAHHRKTRPRKSAPWDIRRGPAVYPPLPLLPPDWSFADEGSANAAASSEASAAPLPDV